MDAACFFGVYRHLEAVHDAAIAVMVSAQVRAARAGSTVEGQPFPHESIVFHCHDDTAVGEAECPTRITGPQAAELALNHLSEKELAPVADRHCLESMREALQQFLQPSSSADYEGIAETISRRIPEIDDIVEELAVSTFGGWGAHFFFVAREHENQARRLFRRTPKRPFFAEAGYEPHELLEDLSTGRPAEDDIVINEAERSVSVRGRPPCKLRDREFYLFLALWQDRGRHVPFLDLAKKTTWLDGRTNSVKSLVPQKSRLCTKLKAEGYADLARCIVSGAESYGLLLGH